MRTSTLPNSSKPKFQLIYFCFHSQNNNFNPWDFPHSPQTIASLSVSRQLWNFNCQKCQKFNCNKNLFFVIFLSLPCSASKQLHSHIFMNAKKTRRDEFEVIIKKKKRRETWGAVNELLIHWHESRENQLREQNIKAKYYYCWGVLNCGKLIRFTTSCFCASLSKWRKRKI